MIVIVDGGAGILHGAGVDCFELVGLRMTICEKCGAEREGVAEQCPACHFLPRTTRELAIASLLTERFEAGGESFGASDESLREIARQIKSGVKPELDEEELKRHEQAVASFQQVRTADVYWTLFRFFLPAALVIAALWALHLALQHLR